MKTGGKSTHVLFFEVKETRRKKVKPGQGASKAPTSQGHPGDLAGRSRKVGVVKSTIRFDGLTELELGCVEQIVDPSQVS